MAHIVAAEETGYFSTIISSIAKDPASWEHWSCLHIESTYSVRAHEKEALAQEILMILDVYLDEAESSVYLYESGDIFVLCKYFPHSLLEKMGSIIRNSIELSTGHAPAICTYDLMTEGWKFVKRYQGLDINEIHPKDRQHCPIDGFQEKRVLLVEDDSFTRNLVTKFLKNHCMLSSAKNGLEALVKFKEERPDMVFLDIGLPDMSGYDILESIMEDHPQTKVVMFSADDTMQNIANTLTMGADGFVGKPFTPAKLVHYLHEAH